MKTGRRRILGILLALCMVLSLLPVTAGAATLPASGSSNGMSWTLSAEGVLTVSGSGGLNLDLSDYCDQVNSIVISSGITSLTGCSFRNYTNLTSVTLPEGLTSIWRSCFTGCTSLQSVSIPASLTFLGEDSFSGTPWLAAQGDFVVVNGTLFLYQGSAASVTIPSTVKKIGEYAFCGNTTITSVTIPYGVTEIGEGAFQNSSALTTINTPVSVTAVGNYAFNGSAWMTNQTGDFVRYNNTLLKYQGSASSVTIPTGITAIGTQAFKGCSGVTDITFPMGVTRFGTDALADTAWFTAQAAKSNFIIVNNVLVAYCGTETKVTIPYGVKAIGDQAFRRAHGYAYNKSATEIIIPDSVTSIGAYAFYDCNALLSITIPASVTSIGNFALGYYWGDGTGGGDKSWTPLSRNDYKNFSITCYAGTAGKTYAADNCFPYTELPFPTSGRCGENVNWSFSNGTLTISGTGAMAEDAVPLFSGLKDQISSAVIGEGVTNVGDFEFYKFPNLTSVSIASTVTTIGTNAFFGCSKLSSVDIKGTGVTANANAFAYCTSLTSIPAGLGELFMGTFKGCTGLKSLSLYEGITYLDWGVFAGCTGAESLSLPASLNRVEFSAFSSCSGLKTITAAAGSEFLTARNNMLTSTITLSVNPATYGTALVLVDRSATGTVSVPVGVTEIEPTAFSGCTGVTGVYVPRSVTEINDSSDDSSLDVPAASGCANLTDVYYEGTEAQWAAVKVYDNYFKNATVHYDSTAPGQTPFTDLADGAYYSVPVLWAVNLGVTTGTTESTFSPGANCTRAQVVTFLWRAAGSPVPKSSDNPFSDVSADSYYYNAVLWAVENGITSGTTATTFSPEQDCTRAQVVTFLWRSENKPGGNNTDNGFADVGSDAYYFEAVLWAVRSGITMGTSSTTFSPDDTCTRGQIVTFLYRWTDQ